MDVSQTAQWLTAALVLTASLGGCLGSDGEPTRSSHLDLHQALIWDHPYPNLIIDINHVEDREPSQLALDALKETLINVTDKRTVTVQTSERVDPGDASSSRKWDARQVHSLHEKSFESELDSLYGAGDTAYLHVLYLNGHYETEEGQIARGVQLGNVLAVFPDRADTVLASVGPYGPPNPAPEVVERSITIHELGHALGLVNLGAPMLTERIYDDACRCHSTMEDSVMYGGASPESGSVLEYYQDNQWVPYKFDKYDLADLEAVRQAGRADAGSR